MEDPYALPSGVLRNLLGIDDGASLESAEADITGARLIALGLVAARQDRQTSCYPPATAALRGSYLGGGSMFFAFVAGRGVTVSLKASGTFFCLYCNADQRYQHRVWESTMHVFFVPLGNTRGEFVLCLNCESTFSPECLDETSTATCDELIMEVPMKAAGANLRFRPRTAPPVFDHEEAEPWSAPPRGGLPAPEAGAPTRSRTPRSTRRH
jgi:hypothetical protein